MFGRRGRKRPDPDELEQARKAARELIHPGFLGYDEAVQAVVEYLEDGPLDDATLRGVADEVWRARLAEQATWNDEGDYGRVAAAFADLERAGFVARMNFTCCQTCGHAEIDDEATGGETSYVFFHMQDAERLIDPDAELFLAFGVFGTHPGIDQATYARAADGDQDARDELGPVFQRLESEAATQIVAAMERQGLSVERRDERARPSVSVPDWRKRLPV